MDLMKKYLSRIKVDDSKSDTIQEKDNLKKQMACKIYSEILEDCLWLVATSEEMQELIAEGIDDAIYTYDDIKKLDGISKDGLRMVNIIKKLLPGSTIEEYRAQN